MATFPLLGYQASHGGSITVDVDGTAEALTLTTAIMHGWHAGAAGVAAGDDLATALATMFTTHSTIGAASLIRYRADSTYLRPVWEITLATTAAAAVVTITNAGLAGLAAGLRTGDTWTGSGNSVTIRSSCRWVGVWSPNCLGVVTDPVISLRGSRATSPYTPAGHDATRYGVTCRRVVEFPWVEFADVTGEAQYIDAAYLTLAGRTATGDVVGTFDEVLSAASLGVPIRLVRGYDDEVSCILDGGDGDLSRAAFATRVDHGGNRWNVVVPLIEAAPYTGLGL